jgi:hypothetical protein
MLHVETRFTNAIIAASSSVSRSIDVASIRFDVIVVCHLIEPGRCV